MLGGRRALLRARSDDGRVDRRAGRDLDASRLTGETANGASRRELTSDVESHVLVLDVSVADLERRRLASEARKANAAVERGRARVGRVSGEEDALQSREFPCASKHSLEQLPSKAASPKRRT